MFSVLLSSFTAALEKTMGLRLAGFASPVNSPGAAHANACSKSAMACAPSPFWAISAAAMLRSASLRMAGPAGPAALNATPFALLSRPIALSDLLRSFGEFRATPPPAGPRVRLKEEDSIRANYSRLRPVITNVWHIDRSCVVTFTS